MNGRRIIPRAEARAAGLQRYFTGRPCKHGHVADRLVSNAKCMACGAEYGAAWRETNAQYQRAWYAANREAEADKKRERYTAQRDKMIERSRAYREANRERIAERQRSYSAANPHLGRQHRATRRARLRNATPPWLTDAERAQIAAIYAEAARLQQETGIPHHVDHIVPLSGRNICGLHVPGNLQILPANENMRKHNRWAE